MKWNLAILFAGVMVASAACAAENLSLRARVSASESYGDLTPEKAIDAKRDTRWSGIPGHNTGVWYQLDWDKPVQIGEVIIHQFDRFTHELDVQVWDAAKGDWRTVQHFGKPARRLPLVVTCRFDAVETTRLRIGNITNGPSFTEVEAYAQPLAAYAPVVRLASDLQGNFIGVITDPWGGAPITAAELTLSGTGGAGDWNETIKGDDQGLFRAPMPPGLTGKLKASTKVFGRTWTDEFDVAEFQYGLTPASPDDRPLSLNGKWRFAIDPPDGFWRPEFDDTTWATINVPAHWQMEGFKGPREIGGYRTRFVPSAGSGRLKLRFDGVYSGAEVWVNGRLVARHEGGFTPFEADVTDAVHEGESLLALRVQEHTQTSDKLDKMSLYADFPLAGIMRKVILFRVPPVHVGALALSTQFDAGYASAMLAGRVAVLNESGRPFRGQLVLQLSDPDGKPVPLDTPPSNLTIDAWARSDIAVSLPVKTPRTWTAEQPNLYRLTLELRADGQPVQRLTQRVGFRQTEIRGTVILINGKPVKFRGTCHHDTHPLLGRAVTPQLERQDLELMKQANLNAVRTSHYPPLPELLDAADELGLYVEDEASFCWVNQADDLLVWPRILQLTAELIARDRNHPSVFMWSLCNESEFGSGFQRSHVWVRREDPSRPTAAATSAWLEIATLHNPLAISRIDENEKLDKPLLFDESLAPFQGIFNDVAEMWVDPGIRDYYARPLPAIYDRFIKSRVTQGSMIWCWADDIFCVPNRGLEYGRGTTRSHFIEGQYLVPGRGLTGDAPWGVVDGWRREKPEFWITKKLHSPIKISEGAIPIPAAGQPIRIAVQNQYDFTDLSQIGITWRLGAEKGELHPRIPPRSSGQIEVAPQAGPRDGDVLRLDFTDSTGRLIDAYELSIGRAVPPKSADVPHAPLVITDEETLAGSGIRITGANVELLFDRGGYLRRCVGFGQALLLEHPTIHVLPTQTPLAPLPNPLTWQLGRMNVERAGENVRVTLLGSYEGFKGTYEFTITPGGQIDTKASFQRTGPDILAREVGLRFSVPRDCDRLRWDRNAEWSVYPDNHIGRPRGLAAAFADHGAQVPPAWDWSQDNSPMGSNDFRSTKRNINSASIGYDKGPSLLIQSTGKQHLRAIVESDRISVHVNDFYGGTNVGWWEWTHNYGQGMSLKNGARIEALLRLVPVRAR
ncbi:MAG: glycoside hydrolase family 2 TIM barrel-domain containing protein [Tepidisphaerales bacterium]